jgi:hypothetical protein
MQDVREGRYPIDMYGFLYVLNDARSALQRVIEGRSERELTELRDAAGWSVKDHLYHLAAWERGIVHLLQKQPRHEGMGIDEQAYRELDVDAMNAVIFEQSRSLPLVEALQAFRSSHQEMLDLLATLTWDDLQQPYSHYAPGDTVEQGDQPVLYWVFGNTAGHFDMHQPWIEAILAQGSDVDK